MQMTDGFSIVFFLRTPWGKEFYKGILAGKFRFEVTLSDLDDPSCGRCSESDENNGAEHGHREYVMCVTIPSVSITITILAGMS